MIRARIAIAPKPGVHDPQGKAIETALARMGFAGVSGVRQGKSIMLTLDEDDRDRAAERIDAMCARLLANPVIETWSVEFE